MNQAKAFRYHTFMREQTVLESVKQNSGSNYHLLRKAKYRVQIFCGIDEKTAQLKIMLDFPYYCKVISVSAAVGSSNISE